MRRTASAVGLAAVLAMTVGLPAVADEPLTLTVTADSVATPMSWSPVVTRGGGWVTGMVTSPTGQVYSRTDVGGAYRWDEAKQTWEQMLLAGSVPTPVPSDYDVESLAAAPSDGRIVYAAAGSGMGSAGGRILRSSDGGRTWRDGGQRFTIHGNGEWRWGGERLSIDPRNPDVVHFGSRKDGIFRTENGGLTWTRLSAPTGSPVGREPAGTMFTLFDPASPVVDGRTQGAWAGVQDVGVLRTDDAGRTWRIIHPITNGVPRDAELAADGKLYVVVNGWTPQVLRFDTRAGGVTNVSPSPGGGFAMVAVDPTNPSRVFLGDDGVRDGKLWRSLNGGGSWTALDVALAADDSSKWVLGTDIEHWMSGGALAFDPVRPGNLWFAEGMGMWRSNDLSDGEVTWDFTSKGIEELVANAAVKPVGKPLVTATWDRGLFRHPTPSTGGAQLPYRKTFGSAWDLASSPTDPDFLVAVLNDHQDPSGARYPDRKASAYSTDGGATWTRFAALAQGTAPADMMFGNIAVSAESNDNIVWAPSNVPAKVYFTRDRGASWSPGTLHGVVAGDYLHPSHYLKRESLAADPSVAGAFYALGGNDRTGDSALWKSVDGGANWTKMTTAGLGRAAWWDFRFNAQLMAVPGQPGVLFAVAGRTDDGGRPVWRSTDGGRTWTAKTELRNAHALAFGAAMTPGGPPSLFTYGTVSGRQGMYRSDDLGDSWTFLTDYPMGWYQTITAITADPEVPGKVYVGFTGGGFTVGELTAPAPVPTTPAPVPTTPAPVPTTPAPVPTTPAPVPTTPAPVPTTPAPVPTCSTTGKKSERCPSQVTRSKTTIRTATATTTTAFATRTPVTPLRVRSTAPVTLSTSVTPAKAGQLVSLEVKVGRGWRSVATTRTTATGAASLRWTSPPRGTTTLRFVTRAGTSSPVVSKSFDVRRS